MKIIADTHTHTVHSHGTGTVEDNVKAAIVLGLKRITISDHGPLHMCYNIKDVEAYLRDIERMREKYAGDIEVLAGVEMNLLSSEGDVDFPEQWKDRFDVFLMGYHKLVRYKTLADRMNMMFVRRSTEKAVERNTRAYMKALDRYPIDIIVHPGYGLPVDLSQLAEYAAKKGVVMEINAKHPEFTPEELSACGETGVKFSIGSDAHSPGRVGDFLLALHKAQAAGITAEQIVNAE